MRIVIAGLLALLAGCGVGTRDESSAWSGKSIVIESLLPDGTSTAVHTIPLEHPYTVDGDVELPMVKAGLSLFAGNEGQLQYQRTITVSCQGEEVVSSSLHLTAQDMRVQFKCFDARYQMRFAGYESVALASSN